MRVDSPDLWARIDDLFHRALDISPDARRAWLAREAGDNAALAARLASLLDAHERSHRLLDAPAPDRLPDGMRIGPYAVERILGAGGMATVYLARRADQRFEKQVAIKLVHQGLAAGLLGERFEREQRILAQLEHPNIARLLDAGVNGFGQPYLVMEWIDGMPLDEWLRTTRPSMDARLNLWCGIASAVSYAHRHLIIHRDLKPSNVLVERDGRARLVDFGIATLVTAETQEAVTRSARYTPLYASPEQLEGRPVTTATDVYSLGLLLGELVTGTHPFRADGMPVHEQARAMLAEEVRMPASVPADLAAIVRQALRHDPNRRYLTADQMAADVDRYRRGLPVIAQPDTFGYRARRFAGRHRVALAAAGGVTLLLVTLTALAVRQARIATEQRVRAEDVSAYLAGFLGAAPDGPDWALRDRGAGLRVVELADLLAKRLAASPAVHPETEATLRYVLGMVYVQTGQLDAAVSHVARARELFAGLAPPEDPRRLSVDLLQAAADNMLGRFAEAEAVLTRVRGLWTDPPPSAKAGIHEQLGLAQFRLGRTEEAERTYREGLAALAGVLGDRHHNMALLRSNLAMVYIERGQFADASRELEEATAIVRASASGASLSLAWGLVNLANAYRFQGRYDDMRHAAEEAAAAMSRALGPDHFAMVHALSFLAFGKALAGEPDAEVVARRAVAVQASLAPDHYERAVGLTFLGAVLTRAGKSHEAVRVLEDALRLRRTRFATPNWRIAETAGFLGEALAAAGHHDRARSLLDESIETFMSLYGPDNPRTLDARSRRQRALTR